MYTPPGVCVLKRKKIALMVSNLCTFGGTERVTANLASELSAFYDVSIITHWQDQDIVFKVDERVKIFNLYSEKKRFRYTFVDGTRRIKNYIENMGIEILLVIGRNNFLLPLLVKVCSDVKMIFCEHSTIAPLCNKNDTLNKGLIVKAMLYVLCFGTLMQIVTL